MKSEHVKARITKFGKMREDAGNDEGALLEVALFIEDMLALSSLTRKSVRKILGPTTILKICPGEI